MVPKPKKEALSKVKNIVISGTNFWNPGDDFVRDGVIKILENLFQGYQINFLFYNFNQDFFPQSKFAGITNMAAKGDLNKYSEHVDAVVIAGLSAGLEINDLYNWIVDTNLLDRVYLIGAGYENDYVDKHISQEPAATIFKNARIITGRTRKKPKFISDYNLPYHHLNCPAILSVPNVKDVNQGKRIENIAFSIQLPHQIGIMNQSCSESMHKLAMNILFKLYHEHKIEVIAHHKSEYFYFVKLFQELGLSVPVIFSSFYRDMFNTYRQYDLIIATRLHACLFGNGHGIPGIVLNDTDRHTHCLDGFLHSVWVNSREKFDSVFREVQSLDLVLVTEEAEKFKDNLLDQYLNVLEEPFGLNVEKINTFDGTQFSKYRQLPSTLDHKDQKNYGFDKMQSVSNKSGGTTNDCFEKKLAERLIDTLAGDLDTKRRVLNIFSRLTKDYWLEKNIENYRRLIQNRVRCFDAASFLNWYAEHFKPRSYLEVGVRRGRSLAQVLVQSPATTAFGFDMWIPDYGCKPEDGIYTSNPGPEFVMQELQNFNCDKLPTLCKGNSHQTLPQFWSDNRNPQQIDLIFVDGDHTYAGAKLDMDISFQHLADGGALVFDDISHPSHPDLEQLWEETKIRYPDCIFIEDSSGMGTGVAFKPPFDKLKHFLTKGTYSQSRQKAGKTQKTGSYDKSVDSNFPIHFFTIVLNGEPFIRYHIEVFKRLPFKWHWHIVEGVADLKHDTAWSLNFGGKITDEFHRSGLSNDGTKEYLDRLEKDYPENITIYRKPAGVFWDGKIEMVNAPVQNLIEECLLWQVDADELWTLEQICDGRDMFLADSGRTAAYYLDRFFVGPGLTITTIDTYGNNTDYEWLRTWRFKPACRWKTHEPPKLCMPGQNGQWIDVAGIKPFKHSETKARGMIFQHYAYATERQLRFKEVYYGYKKAIEGWRALQNQNKFPVFLRDYFSWVKDAAQVNIIASQNIVPLFKKVNNNQWQFDLLGIDSGRNQAPILRNGNKILYVRTDSIGDNILAMPIIVQLKEKTPTASITVLCQEHIAELYEASPLVDAIISFDKQYAYKDEAYRSDIIKKLHAVKPDSVLNTVYSREPLTDLFALGSGALERVAFNGNLCNISEEMREKHNQFYTRLLPDNLENKSELQIHQSFLKGVGIDSPSLQPIMWLASEDEAFADDFFASQSLQRQKTIALFAGAQNEVRRYRQYGVALAQICKDNDFSVIALGGKADYTINQESLDAIGNRRTSNLCGKTTLRQTAALLKRCRLAVGAETGLAHVACAVETPNVILLGGGHFGRFMPYSPLTSVVCLPLDCYACDWQCSYPRAHCIRDVSPAVITAAIKQTLQQSSTTPRVFVQTEFAQDAQKEQSQWKKLDSYMCRADVEIIPVDDSASEANANDLNVQGETCFAEGDLDGALDAFTRALDITPGFAVTHNNLGVLYYNLGEIEEALNHYKRSTALQPNNTTFQKNLADFYYIVQGQTEKALEIYVKVLSANPEDVEALSSLGLISADLNRIEAAQEFFNRILKIEPWNKEAKQFLEKNR